LRVDFKERSPDFVEDVESEPYRDYASASTLSSTAAQRAIATAASQNLFAGKLSQ